MTAPPVGPPGAGASWYPRIYSHVPSSHFSWTAHPFNGCVRPRQNMPCTRTGRMPMTPQQMRARLLMRSLHRWLAPDRPSPAQAVAQSPPKTRGRRQHTQHGGSHHCRTRHAPGSSPLWAPMSHPTAWPTGMQLNPRHARARAQSRLSCVDLQARPRARARCIPSCQPAVYGKLLCSVIVCVSVRARGWGHPRKCRVAVKQCQPAKAMHSPAEQPSKWTIVMAALRRQL